MTLKRLLLHNLYGKVVSLVIAFAIWYLIYDNVSRPTQKYDPGRYPVPGTAPSPIEASPIDSGPTSPILEVPIPGGTGMNSTQPIQVIEMVERTLYRNDWVEIEDYFADSVLVFPGVDVRG